MRKTVKVLVTVFMLGLVASLTSCMEFAEAMVGSMSQTAYLFDVTYTAKTSSGKKVELKFNNSNLEGRYKLNAWIDGKSVDNDKYTWSLSNENMNGADSVYIYQINEQGSHVKISSLKPNEVAGNNLTVEETFKIGSETISKGTIFTR